MEHSYDGCSSIIGISEEEELIFFYGALVVNHYMYMQERKLNGFVLNKSVQKIVENGIIRAKDIPLEDIVQPTHEDNI